MRDFCWACHRPRSACFCAHALPFTSDVDFALIVHPYEVRSTVGTAWIMRRSMLNLGWFRSKGSELDLDPLFLKLISDPGIVPLLLFPGPLAFNLSRAPTEDWQELVPETKRPLFIVIDGTWTQARAMLRRSKVLSALPRVSFDSTQRSEYGFKIQPHPACLSSVEGVHRVIEILASRGWSKLPPERAHDRMIEIFRAMVRFQLQHEGHPAGEL